ncbi:MAG TPA: hypothetical protein VFW02_07775, partial [Candidatus Limnocylindrales bacterium]|nr:hypothetical protein [Candidatus Limnocylindrales bacterium]
KRRPSRAPGGIRPDRRWSHPILLGALLLVLAACGSSTSTDQPIETDQPSSAVAGPTETPTTGPTSEPASEPPTTTPEPSTAEPPATPEATATAAAGSAAACSGSDENRDFFASMAAAVDWTVYCPVLAEGWFVDDGRYRLAGGGWLEISYDGPGDTRLILRQGSFCTTEDGCVPSGREVGATAFADRTGTLTAGDDGTWSVVVERGSNPSWLLVVNGLDEAAVRRIAADMHPVAS